MTRIPVAEQRALLAQGLRLCAKCRETLPLASFSPSPTSRNRDGYQAHCRKCRAAAQQARRLANPTLYRATQRACAERNRASANARQAEANRVRPEQMHARNARYWEKISADPERLARKREYDRAYYREKQVDAKRQYYETHKDEIADRTAAYQRSNRELGAERSQRYSLRKKQNGGDFTLEEWQSLQAHYGHRCLACGAGGPLHADHVIPVSKGGSNSISNIQPLCGPCNSRKHAKTIDYRPPHS